MNKAVLLIDNAPSHPLGSDLVSDDDETKTMFINPIVTSLCQPMDQGVIATLKNYYHFNLMEKLVEEDANLITFWKIITIKDALYSVLKTSDPVKQTLLICA